MSAGTPVIFDDGSKALVPQEKLSSALKDGGKVAQAMQFDDGSRAYVSLDRVHDAIHDGGMLIGTPPQAPKSDMQIAGVTVPSPGRIPGAQMPAPTVTDMEAYQGLKGGAAAGGLPLALSASLPAIAGGVVGGTLGTAGGRAIAKGAGGGENTQEIAGDVGGLVGGSLGAGAADAAATKAMSAYRALPEEVQDALVGIISPRVKEGVRLATALKPNKEPVFPNQPLGPDVPAPEVLQAASLTRGPRPVVDPAQGLGSIPVAAQPGAAGSMAESVAAPKVTPKVVEQQLNQALGGKPLQPNVPLKNQVPGAKLPDGFSPLESSALKGYKYDPTSKEFETITHGGQHYVYGDVSPEVAARFEASDSKGSAWGDLRKAPGVALVKKSVNGKLVSVKPTAQAAASPEGDLTSQLQASLEQAQKAKGNPRFVYRARDVGEEGIPLSNDHAQATSDLGQAMKYAEAGQRGPQAGQIVRVDLSQLKPSDYVVKTHPNGAKWIQFTRPLTENEVSVFAGKTAGKK